ncbi:type IV secretory system conjugative DNA transfer family protein [Mycolicibacterium neoaurum]|uniref:type IV secretory system conjugative DNA transfer family protein n=1 Tax=Mycolicibacterium neoaurum TaxID=1795 RepID=UPI00248BC79E|nr:type IV secretory system conjugative DNA transfer family protein [Mycolicibacterium neoaurum]WBP93229.1 type IV secretory system conjugative DNA transfer family protein [Mycolicibacterium neoaurum]WBS06804.1 type IV secretory system conjugative DNA transfer family protein [Mycolicibacterium neoaurum]
MNPSTSLVFHRLWLPRPLDAARVLLVLQRLAADPLSPWLVLETRATVSGVAHLVAVHRPQVPWLYQTLHHLLPGIAISAKDTVVDRPGCQGAAEITFVPDAVALRTDDPVAITTAILSALATRLSEGDTIVVQYILGPRRGGHHVRSDAHSPHQSPWSLLSRGNQPLPSATRAQIEDRVAQHGFLTCVRIGVAAAHPTIRRHLFSNLAGALGTARSTGVRLKARRCKPAVLDAAMTPRRWRQRLAPHELAGLIAWPIGDGDLPGVPPIHPRLLLPVIAPEETTRVVGTTALPGTEQPIGISPRDGLMHSIVMGPTGSGKSNSLLLLIKPDIAGKRPLLVIDPKWQLIADILATCIAEDRIDDVVLFDPTLPMPPGYNPLDAGDRNIDVLVDSLLAVLKAVFADGWGPRTEDIFLSSLLTLARAGQHRAKPYTLVDLPQLLTDARFRQRVLAEARPDPVLAGFWAAYDDMTPAAQSAMIAAPMNKLRRYLLRPAARNILGQPAPKFRLRDLFRENKIVLVPLNDALIGPVTAELLGSLIVAEAWQATQERASEHEPMRRPGTVIVDECQRFIKLPTSFGDALSQSRSYGVGWVLAHQQRSQLPNDLADAIDSNARNKLIFRLESASDAGAMAKLAPGLDAEDFQKLPKYHAYARVVVGGESSGWCTVITNPPPPPTGLAETIRHRSRELYGGTPPTRPSPYATTPKQGADPDATPVGRKRRTKHETNDAGAEKESSR